MKLVGLVFSKDRAMQLCAALESFFARCRDAGSITLHVLYKVSEDMHRRQYDVLRGRFGGVVFVEEQDFRQQTIEIAGRGDYILFMVDDNIFVRDFRLGETIEGLSRNGDALGFSLRVGRNAVHNYSRDVRMTLPDFAGVAEGVLRYDWTRRQHDFGYPLEVSSSVYRRADILPLLQQIDFSGPNLLEGQMAASAGGYAARRPALLCFDLSVAFCNPLNLVQSVCKNRTGGDGRFSAERLAALFEAGWRIDIEQYNGLIPAGCHQDVELHLRTNEATAQDLPLVTVEMVTYNGERFIGKAMASVLAQTYGNIELLIVDDGSTDRTAEIAGGFNDGRIRYLRREHKGRWAQTNHALGEANGRFVMAVDSDDYIAPDYIERMMVCAMQHPQVDYFYPSQLYLVDEDNRHTGVCWQYDDFSDNRVLPRVLLERGNSPIPYPGSLRRKKMFEKTGLYEEAPNAADFAFLCQNALKVNFKRVERHGTYFYRTLSSSLSQNYAERAQTVAFALKGMISIYAPEVLCPFLTDISDKTERRRRYYSYLADTFGRHARQYPAGEAGHFALGAEFDAGKLPADRPAAGPSISAHKAPAATVEMVTYNGERFIAKAIESVLGQTCEDWELIIVDDGSTDGTAEIVARYPDNRIRYVRQAHKNAAAARNRVICEARGEFLLCVDSDDFIESDYLAGMLQCAAQEPEADYFYPAALALVDADGAGIGEWRYADVPDNRVLPGWLFFHGASPIPNPGSLKRRRLFDRTGPYEELETVEDFAFLCRHALQIRFARAQSHGRYFYRRLDQSLSQRGRSRDRITADVLNRMVSYYRPELICPKLAEVADEELRSKLYCVYLKEIFYKHAGGYHMVKHGEYFRRYGDHYRMQLELPQARRSAGSHVNTTQGG